MEVGVKLWAELNRCRTECNRGTIMNVKMHLWLLQRQRKSWPPDKISRVSQRGLCIFLSNAVCSAFGCKLRFNQEYCSRCIFVPLVQIYMKFGH